MWRCVGGSSDLPQKCGGARHCRSALRERELSHIFFARTRPAPHSFLRASQSTPRCSAINLEAAAEHCRPRNLRTIRASTHYLQPTTEAFSSPPPPLPSSPQKTPPQHPHHAHIRPPTKPLSQTNPAKPPQCRPPSRSRAPSQRQRPSPPPPRPHPPPPNSSPPTPRPPTAGPTSTSPSTRHPRRPPRPPTPSLSASASPPRSHSTSARTARPCRSTCSRWTGATRGCGCRGRMGPGWSRRWGHGWGLRRKGRGGSGWW